MNKGQQLTPVIGLEIHLQLKTRTKLFCSCSTDVLSLPNTHICPVCLGYPGTMPVLNKKVIKMAIDMGASLGMTLNPIWKFSRKNYFYPDLPKGYQITMTDSPVALNGEFNWISRSRQHTVRLRRLHIEEDAARLIHAEEFCPADKCLVDYNRCGIPLLELVTEPDFHDSSSVVDFLKSYRSLARNIRVSECQMSMGHMRVDVNISLRDTNPMKQNGIVEVKNLNSLKSIKRAIDSELQKQVSLLKRGVKIQRQTKRYDDDMKENTVMRDKECLPDYKYFEEPDLPVIILSSEQLHSTDSDENRTPFDRYVYLKEKYRLPDTTCEFISLNEEDFDFLNYVLEKNVNPEMAANLYMQDFQALKSRYSDYLPEPEHFADLIKQLSSKSISMHAARKILAESFMSGHSLADLLITEMSQGRIPVSKIEFLVNKVLDTEPEKARQWKSGQSGLLGYFIGKARQQSQDLIDPRAIRLILESKLKNDKKENPDR